MDSSNSTKRLTILHKFFAKNEEDGYDKDDLKRCSIEYIQVFLYCEYALIVVCKFFTCNMLILFVINFSFWDFKKTLKFSTT